MSNGYQETAEANSQKRVLATIVTGTLCAYVAGLTIFAYALHSGDGVPSGWRIFGTAIIVGAAVAVAGGLLGFLFGMPRGFRAGPQPSNPAGAPAGGGADASGNAGQAAGKSDAEKTSAQPAAHYGQRGISASWDNDNLVEVSDWLTKIVVGVSLVQIKPILDWISQVGTRIGEGVNLAAPLDQSFGVAVILVNFGIGFVVTYVYARTILSLVFATSFRATQDALSEEIEKIQASQERSERNVQSAILEVARGAGGASTVLPYLYQDPPAGFERAIELAQKLLQDEPHDRNGQLWGYLACAFGQKFSYSKKQGLSEGELNAIADEVYKAASTALQLEPNLKGWMHALWDPNGPNAVPGEDDLNGLFHDPQQKARFAALLE